MSLNLWIERRKVANGAPTSLTKYWIFLLVLASCFLCGQFVLKNGL
jgi:hypothetical protein